MVSPSFAASAGGAHELHELGGADDRVRLTGPLDQLLLRDLGAHVSAVGHPVGADDGERDVVSDGGVHLGREQVLSGGLEEFEHRGVLEGR
jgi:hypothetical protein